MTYIFDCDLTHEFLFMKKIFIKIMNKKIRALNHSKKWYLLKS